MNEDENQPAPSPTPASPPSAPPAEPLADPGKSPPAPLAAPASPSPAKPPATPPPAAEIVVKGGKTERELRLEQDLKNRETRLAELEDENRRLKTPPARPEPVPPPKAAEQKRSWMAGLTFFDDED